jgi:uncharacterized protein YjdB
MQVSAKVFPTHDLGALQKVTWSSSSTKIAKVDANGVITPVKPGTVTITAKAADGSGKSVSFTLKVVKLVKTVTVTNSTLTVKGGKTLTLKLAFNPTDASSKAVTYSLRPEDLSFASVSSKGVVTAKKVTSTKTVEVTVTAKENPAATTTVTVTIIP